MNNTPLSLPFLTDAEIREIAKPLRQPAAIVNWLQKQGFCMRIKPNGMPLISRAHFEAVMACAHEDSTPLPQANPQPDVAALFKRFNKNIKSVYGPQEKDERTWTA